MRGLVLSSVFPLLSLFFVFLSRLVSSRLVSGVRVWLTLFLSYLSFLFYILFYFSLFYRPVFYFILSRVSTIYLSGMGLSVHGPVSGVRRHLVMDFAFFRIGPQPRGPDWAGRVTPPTFV